MTDEPSPSVNHAALELIKALESTSALAGFREGLQRTIVVTEARARPTDPSHAEAIEALKVWRVLDALCAAIADKRGNDA